MFTFIRARSERVPGMLQRIIRNLVADIATGELRVNIWIAIDV